MSDLEPFESPKELVIGAVENLAEIKAACDLFGETQGYEILTEKDVETGEEVVYLRLKEKFPPRIMRLISSVIKELRLALDQAFCDAAVLLGRPNAKKICFPFGKSIEDLNRTIETSCKNVDRLLIDYCLTFKPYYGGDTDGILWTMSKLAGTYHRSLVGARFQDQGAFVKAVVACQGPLKLIVNKWDGRKNQFEVARLESGSRVQVQENFALPLNVIFPAGSYALEGRPVVESLAKLASMAEGIVSGIEAETTRILRERRLN